jgi:hypothetical protein
VLARAGVLTILPLCFDRVRPAHAVQCILSRVGLLLRCFPSGCDPRAARARFDGERAMKMTSRFTLLVTLAGVAGLGCSAPADGGDDPAPAPTAPPPYFAMQQPPAPNQQMTNPLTPTPTPVTPAPTPVTPTPAPTGAAGAGGVAMPMGNIMAGAPGTGLALTPTLGWVAGSTNEAGIQGSFYTVSDATVGGATMIQPADFKMSAGATICASGTASQVVGEDYTTYWGGGIGFDLADPGNMMPIQPFSRGRVVGFRYTLSGTNIPPSLRFQVAFFEGAGRNAGTYCAPAGGAGPVTMMLGGATSTIVASCWLGAAATTKIPDTAPLASIQWQVPTVTTATTPFNFCIENLTAIVQ